MKQTMWSISCSSSWISNNSSELQGNKTGWLTSGAGGRWLKKRERDCIRWERARRISQKHTFEIFNLALINSCLFQTQIELSYMAMPLCWGLLHALQEIWFIHLAYCWLWLEHSPGGSPVNWFLTIHDSPQAPTLLWHSCKSTYRESLTAPHITLHINRHHFFRKLFLSCMGASKSVYPC